MKKEEIFIGKTVEDALKSGLDSLGLKEENITYEVIEHEKKGILGIGASPAKIKIIYSAKKSGSEAAVEYVKTLLNDMEIEAETSFEKTTSNRYKLSINGESAGILIGHHGDTLDALQYLVNLAVNKREEEGEKGEYMNITVDVENYREKREEALKSLARRMAAKVLKYKRSVTLEPMLPYERRIIHSEIQGIEGVSTNSIGVDNNRKVVIFLEEVGFQKYMEKGERRTEKRPLKDRRSQNKSSNDRKRDPASIVTKIEKKQASKIEIDDYDDGDYSSTAYLREPTKRFSSFAEYESHMAMLANEENNKKEASSEE